MTHDLSSHCKHELGVVVQNQYSLFIRFYKGLYAFDKKMFVFLPKILEICWGKNSQIYQILACLYCIKIEPQAPVA